MYRGVSVAVVLPAYNVAAHLEGALATMPSFVDRVIVVDDASTDTTWAIACRVRDASPDGRRVVVVRHDVNRGVGAAIATGYDLARAEGIPIAAVMAGDGQMDPADLPGLLDPLVEGRADYAKGNRFAHADLRRAMPRARIFGNVVLSLLTKISAGYPHLFDSQCGYTAISGRALDAIEGRFFSRYGYPNDLLARLGAVDARVVDVPVRPVYDGQASGIRLWTVIYPMLFVLARSFVRRIWVRRLRPLWGRPAPLLASPPTTEALSEGTPQAEAPFPLRSR